MNRKKLYQARSVARRWGFPLPPLPPRTPKTGERGPTPGRKRAPLRWELAVKSAAVLEEEVRDARRRRRNSCFAVAVDGLTDRKSTETIALLKALVAPTGWKGGTSDPKWNKTCNAYIWSTTRDATEEENDCKLSSTKMPTADEDAADWEKKINDQIIRQEQIAQTEKEEIDAKPAISHLEYVRKMQRESLEKTERDQIETRRRKWREAKRRQKTARATRDLGQDKDHKGRTPKEAIATL